MSTELTIIFIGGLVFLSHFFVNLFERTKIPDVIWLTLIGFFLGPIFGVVEVRDFGEVGYILTKITLVIILFEGGLELGVDTLKKYSSSAVFLTILAYIITAAILWGFLSLLPNFDSLGALYCAAVLAGPAPSVIMPLLKKLELKQSTKTILSLESTLGEAICILVALAVLQSFRTHGGISAQTFEDFDLSR